MNRNIQLLRTALSICLVGPVWLAGCSGNAGTMMPAPGGDEAPEIPPESSMVMDFQDFQGNARVSNQLIENWGRSFFSVALWSTAVTVTLAVPVAAFRESFNHTPERRTDGTWVWGYDVPVNGMTFSAELTAAATGDEIEWNMFLSKEGEYSDVNWFSGRSNLTVTSGTWRLNHKPTALEPFLDIEWSQDPGGVPADIRYTNIQPGESNHGGFIYYAVTDGADYDRVYEIYLPADENRVNIEWNSATMAGRLKEPNHFGDDVWHCWSTELRDVACPDGE